MPKYTMVQRKSSAAKKNLIIGFAILLVVGAAYFYMRRGETPEDRVNGNVQSNSQQTNSKSNASNIRGEEPDTSLPAKLQLTVPFTAQAPTANWDELHNEACEEASAIMANAYFNGVTSLPPATVEKQIDALTKWQQDNFGYYLSINTQEVVEMIEANYNLNAEIAEISENTIKKALSENKLVIVPTNGQMLDNPNFKQPGPIYHMFVITGYNAKNFITNDPGTRKGLNYEYSYETIEAATGNWEPGPHAVNLDDKKIIIVSK